ncbi:MAG: DUF1700 domain-containing protein [Clostridiales bacterium]|nr:DUF1700 domain-containing protein [Clostridiales bacterium]
MEDFFRELEECLRGEVSDTELRDAIDYYHEYFREQRSGGKTDEEILSSLGSPRLIARSIIDAREAAEEQQQARYYNDGYSADAPYEEYSDEERSDEEQKGFDGNKIKAILLLIVILVIIGMLIRVLLPVILVGIAVIFIAGLFQRRG